jgi:hypothetical protein
MKNTSENLTIPDYILIGSVAMGIIIAGILMRTYIICAWIVNFFGGKNEKQKNRHQIIHKTRER